METVDCIICGSEDAGALFAKASERGELFTLMKCSGCGLEYISPRPSLEEMKEYYGTGYFCKRTERGYDNYFSGKVRGEIERVFRMNLADLGFFPFEHGLQPDKRCLDIGCAAGYFVGYMKDRGWDSMGIDVSGECVDFAVSNGLHVINGNYLDVKFEKKFSLITLWASLEHLHRPDMFLEKIRDDLDDGGRLYLSTCRTGGMNFKSLFGKGWRFYNFPEHLYFFSMKTMGRLLSMKGFTMTGYRTYGSGIGSGRSLLKKGADFMAKEFYMGDMMIIGACKAG